MICDGQVNPWIPVDYNGCYIQFTDRLLGKMWRGLITQQRIYDDSLGGEESGILFESADEPPLDEWREASPICTARPGSGKGSCEGFYMTLGHSDPDAGHPFHEWECQATVEVYYRPTGRLKKRKGRLMRMWKGPAITAKVTVPPEIERWPWCFKAADLNDGWPGVPPN